MCNLEVATCFRNPNFVAKANCQFPDSPERRVNKTCVNRNAVLSRRLMNVLHLKAPSKHSVAINQIDFTRNAHNLLPTSDWSPQIK